MIFASFFRLWRWNRTTCDDGLLKGWCNVGYDLWQVVIINCAAYWNIDFWLLVHFQIKKANATFNIKVFASKIFKFWVFFIIYLMHAIHHVCSLNMKPTELRIISICVEFAHRSGHITMMHAQTICDFCCLSFILNSFHILLRRKFRASSFDVCS